MEDKNSQNKFAEKFSFALTLDDFLSAFPKRTRDIIKSRFGVSSSDSKAKTLDEIGRRYGITRERIRQIIGEVIKKSARRKKSASFQKASEKIEFTIKQNNGIITEEKLLDALSRNNQEKFAATFFLKSADVIHYPKTAGILKKTVCLSDFNLKEWEKTRDAARQILEYENRPLEKDYFFQAVQLKKSISDKKKFFNFLSVSEEIGKNVFGKWGMRYWEEITPKGSRQKAYLVIKEYGRPLHFKEVTRLIDKYNLSKKKSHPQTVHNELIKDSRFILVGRGTYGLAQWGCEEGTVKDLLGNILGKSEKPLERDEILNQVLTMKQVKKSTVMINLNNFFKKVGRTRYTIKKV